MNNYLRYYDERFGDVFEIYVDHDGNFIRACRSVEAIGRDPIYYEELEEIPPTHRRAIEQMLMNRQKDGQ